MTYNGKQGTLVVIGVRNVASTLVPTVIRVLWVRNRLLVREALAAMLQMQPDISIPAHVGSIGEAIRMIGLVEPIDCAVVEFESGSNVSFFADLTALRKSTRILLIGGIMQPQELEALRPIVASILPNSSNSGALIEAIRGIPSGQTWEKPSAFEWFRDARANDAKSQLHRAPTNGTTSRL
jgi:two-component system, NarL family, response regulator DesR